MPHPTPTPDHSNTLRETTDDGRSALCSTKNALDRQQIEELEELLDGVDQSLDEGRVPSAEALRITALRVTYADLPAEIRQSCPLEEYVSPAFAAEAATHQFSPFQWASVRQVLSLPGVRAAPSFFEPHGPRHLTLLWGLTLVNISTPFALPPFLTTRADIHLGGCTGITALPPHLTVQCLYLHGCTSLSSLPPDLIVKQHLDLSGCTPEIKGEGRRMYAEGRVGGRLYLYPPDTR